MMDRLVVFLKGRRIGVIDRDTEKNSTEFSYDVDYLSARDAVPISLSLPLSDKPYDSLRTRIFFENLLPPDVVRRKLEKILHHDHGNYFAFLKALGGDCAGAISLYPNGLDPSVQEDTVRELSEDEADEILKALPERPLLQGVVENYRISVAGAQAKLVARVRNGKIALPLFGTASTHIVKPGMSLCGQSVENECFCQQLAAEMDVAAAKSSISRIKDSLYYVTERYDRAEHEGVVTRYLQEDFCQAMGVDSEQKYQIDGGPSAARCFLFLRDRGFGANDLYNFIDYFLYNFLIGNADAHAKNFSILYRDGNKCMAPIYDAMSTLVYPQVVNTMAMEIGGQYEFGNVTRDSFVAFARKCDVNPKAVLSRLDRLAAELPQKAAGLKEKMSDAGFHSPIYDEIRGVIERHIGQTVA